MSKIPHPEPSILRKFAEMTKTDPRWLKLEKIFYSPQDHIEGSFSRVIFGGEFYGDMKLDSKRLFRKPSAGYKKVFPKTFGFGKFPDFLNQLRDHINDFDDYEMKDIHDHLFFYRFSEEIFQKKFFSNDIFCAFDLEFNYVNVHVINNKIDLLKVENLKIFCSVRDEKYYFEREIDLVESPSTKIPRCFRNGEYTSTEEHLDVDYSKQIRKKKGDKKIKINQKTMKSESDSSEKFQETSPSFSNKSLDEEFENTNEINVDSQKKMFDVKGSSEKIAASEKEAENKKEFSCLEKMIQEIKLDIKIESPNRLGKIGKNSIIENMKEKSNRKKKIFYFVCKEDSNKNHVSAQFFENAEEISLDLFGSLFWSKEFFSELYHGSSAEELDFDEIDEAQKEFTQGATDSNFDLTSNEIKKNYVDSLSKDILGDEFLEDLEFIYKSNEIFSNSEFIFDFIEANHLSFEAIMKIELEIEKGRFDDIPEMSDNLNEFFESLLIRFEIFWEMPFGKMDKSLICLKDIYSNLTDFFDIVRNVIFVGNKFQELKNNAVDSLLEKEGFKILKDIKIEPIPIPKNFREIRVPGDGFCGKNSCKLFYKSRGLDPSLVDSNWDDLRNNWGFEDLERDDWWTLDTVYKILSMSGSEFSIYGFNTPLTKTESGKEGVYYYENFHYNFVEKIYNCENDFVDSDEETIEKDKKKETQEKIENLTKKDDQKSKIELEKENEIKKDLSKKDKEIKSNKDQEGIDEELKTLQEVNMIDFYSHSKKNFEAKHVPIEINQINEVQLKFLLQQEIKELYSPNKRHSDNRISYFKKENLSKKYPEDFIKEFNISKELKKALNDPINFYWMISKIRKENENEIIMTNCFKSMKKRKTEKEISLIKTGNSHFLSEYHFYESFITFLRDNENDSIPSANLFIDKNFHNSYLRLLNLMETRVFSALSLTEKGINQGRLEQILFNFPAEKIEFDFQFFKTKKSFDSEKSEKIQDDPENFFIRNLKKENSCFEKFLLESDSKLFFSELSIKDLKPVLSLKDLQERTMDKKKKIDINQNLRKIKNIFINGSKTFENHISYSQFPDSERISPTSLICRLNHTKFKSDEEGIFSLWFNKLSFKSSFKERYDLMMKSRWVERPLEILSTINSLREEIYQGEYNQDKSYADLILEECEPICSLLLEMDFETEWEKYKRKLFRNFQNQSSSDSQRKTAIISMILINQKLLEDSEIETFRINLSNTYSDSPDRIGLKLLTRSEDLEELDEESLLNIFEELQWDHTGANSETLYLLDTNIYVKNFLQGFDLGSLKLTIFIPKVVVNEIERLNEENVGLKEYFVNFIRFNSIVLDFENQLDTKIGDEEILKYDKKCVLVTEDKKLSDQWKGLKISKKSVDFIRGNRCVVPSISTAGDALGRIFLSKNQIGVFRPSDIQAYLNLKLDLTQDVLIPDLPLIIFDDNYEYDFDWYQNDSWDEQVSKWDLEIDDNKIIELARNSLTAYESSFNEVSGFSVRTKKQLIELKRKSLKENYQESGKNHLLIDNYHFNEINKFDKNEPDCELGPFTKLENGTFKQDSNDHLLEFKKNDQIYFIKSKYDKKLLKNMPEERKKRTLIAKEKIFLQDPWSFEKSDHNSSRFPTCFSEKNEEVNFRPESHYSWGEYGEVIEGLTPEMDCISDIAYNYKLWTSKSLEEFSLQHVHMINDFVRASTKKKTVLINHNNFYSHGYIIHRSRPARMSQSKKQVQYFFIGMKRPNHFHPFVILENGRGSKMFVSRPYDLSLGDIIYRSRLYDSLFTISRFKCCDLDRLYWILFFRSKNVCRLLSFFKFYNTISNSTYGRLDNLTKKYLVILPKRRSEEYLLDQILKAVKSNSKREARTIFGPTKDLHEYLEIGNLYSFVPLDITSTYSDYLNFYFDIKKNLKSSARQIKPKNSIFGNEPDNFLKGVSPAVLSESLNLYKSNIPQVSEEELLREMEGTFNSFFNTNTKGTDPRDLKKKTNSVIHLGVMELYKEEMEKKSKKDSFGRFSVFHYIEWCLSKAKKRGCMTLVAGKPQKDASNREIYIQEYYSKASHFVWQTFFRSFSNRWQNELVSKSELSKLESIANMDFKNSCYVNIDMAKWSPHDLKIKFKMLVEMMRSKEIISRNIYNILMNSFDVIEDINILFDTRLNIIPGLDWFSTKELAEKGIKNSKSERLSRSELINGKGRYLTNVHMSFGWPQGLMHFASSFVHCLKGIYLGRLIKTSIGIERPIKYLYLEHSDDGNESISSNLILNKREKLMLPCLSSIVGLMVSLKQSETKVSLSLDPTSLHFETEGRKLEDQFSELVSVYNINGKIYNSWVRQSSEISSSFTFRSFNMNHLSLITRCITISGLSNQNIWPEIIYHHYLKKLKKFFFNSSEMIFDKTLQWGGDKAVSLRMISEFGFWSDNFVKFSHDPGVISEQVDNPVSESILIPDMKSKRKFNLEYSLRKLTNFFHEKGKSDISDMIEHEFNRISSTKSGVFLKQRDADFFNFYKHKNSRNLSIFKERRDHRKEVEEFQKNLEIQMKENPNWFKKLEKKDFPKAPEKPTYTSSEIRDKEIKPTQITYVANELIVGTSNILNLLKTDIISHSRFIMNESLNLNGSIKKNDLSTPFAITSDFSEACDLITNPILFRRSAVFRQKYNQVSEDVKSFCKFSGILTIKEFLESGSLWDFFKLIGRTRGSIRLNYISDTIMADGKFSFDSENSLNHNLGLQMITFKNKYIPAKPTFKKRNKNFQSIMQKELQRKMVKLFLNEETEMIDFSDFPETRRLYSIRELQRFSEKVSNPIIKVILCYLTKTVYSNAIRGIGALDRWEDDDLTIFSVGNGTEVDVFFMKSDDIFTHSEINPSLKALIRQRDKIIKYDDEFVSRLRTEYRSQTIVSPGLVKSCKLSLTKDTRNRKKIQLAFQTINMAGTSPIVYINCPLRITGERDSDTDNILAYIRRQGGFIQFLDNRTKEKMTESLRNLQVKKSKTKEIIKSVFPEINYEIFSSIDLLTSETITKDSVKFLSDLLFDYLGQSKNYCSNHSASRCLGPDNDPGNPVFCLQGRGPNNLMIARILSKFKSERDTKEKFHLLENEINNLRDGIYHPIVIGNIQTNFNNYVHARQTFESITNSMFGKSMDFDSSIKSVESGYKTYCVYPQDIPKISKDGVFNWSFEQKAFIISHNEDDFDNLEDIIFKPKTCCPRPYRSIMLSQHYENFKIGERLGFFSCEDLLVSSKRSLFMKMVRQEFIEEDEIYSSDWSSDLIENMVKEIGSSFLNQVENLDYEKEILDGMKFQSNSWFSQKRKINCKILSKIGLTSKLLIQNCLTKLAKDIEKGDKWMDKIIMKDSESDFFLILVTEIESVRPLINEDDSSYQTRIEMAKASRINFDLVKFDIMGAVNFANKFFSGWENEDEYNEEDDEVNPLDSQFNNEYCDSINVSRKELFDSNLFLDSSISNGYIPIQQLESLVHVHNLPMRSNQSLRQSLDYFIENQSMSLEQQKLINEWSQRISNDKRNLAIDIILAEYSNFEPNHIEILNEFKRTGNFSPRDEKKISVMSSKGDFLVTGFRSGDVTSSIMQCKSLGIKFNIRDKLECQKLNDLAWILTNLSEFRFNEIPESSQVMLFELKWSLYHLTRLTDVVFFEPKKTFDCSLRALDKVLGHFHQTIYRKF
jgi:hypothetical protein